MSGHGPFAMLSDVVPLLQRLVAAVEAVASHPPAPAASAVPIDLRSVPTTD
jgi:hypothetical protein